MGIGNLGPMELIIILVIILVLFGARKVPDIGASIGKGIREFKRNLGGDADQQVCSGESDTRSRDRLTPGDRDTNPAPRVEEEARPEPRRLI